MDGRPTVAIPDPTPPVRWKATVHIYRDGDDYVVHDGETEYAYEATPDGAEFAIIDMKSRYTLGSKMVFRRHDGTRNGCWLGVLTADAFMSWVTTKCC
jgi:hypothetical protein